MHAAPSVTYPVGRSLVAGALLALLSLAGLAVVAGWTLQSAHVGWRQLFALAAVAACTALAWRGWRRSPCGALRWNGVEWQWEEAGSAAAGRPEIALDLQSRLLLRWRGDGGGTRWLWLERKAKQDDWDALRRAVYSRASTPVPTAANPPAAEQ